MKRLLSAVRTKRPLTIAVAALLLVALVGAALVWQVGAHASSARVNLTLVSAPGDAFADDVGNTGSAVLTYGTFGCTGVDTNGFCTGGAWQTDSVPDAHWIWETQVTQPAQDGHAVTFSKTFTIPPNATAIAGTIQITADNAFDLQVNGTAVGQSHDWSMVSSFDVGAALRPGQNTISAKVSNDCCFNAWGNPAGLIYRADLSYVPDNTAPTTTATITGPHGTNGWYRGPVTLTLQASDPDDAAGALTTRYSTDNGATWQPYTSALTFAQDDKYTVLYRSVDPAGNEESVQQATINVDQTSPELHITGAASGTSSYCAGIFPTRPTFAPSDNLSGLDGSQGDSWTTPSTATGAGAYVYTAHAQDMAGNSTKETRTYTVEYGSAFGGVLSPIAPDGSSSFALGQTVPVKFQILCNGTPVTNAVASLTVSQNGSVAGNANSTSAATTGNLFRYDSTSQQYVFNMSTKNGYTNPDGSTATFTTGTWTLTITLDDGSTHAYAIQLS